MSEKPETTGESRNEKGQFIPGVSGNPAGRPKGISIKDRVRMWLENNPDDMEDFVKHFVKENRALAWQMLEGKPQQDITTDGKEIQPILVKFLDAEPIEDNRDSEGV